MSKKPLVAGNWKMHLRRDEAIALARSIADHAKNLDDREIMIAPVFTALAPVAEVIKDSGLLLGAQNVAWEQEGAFTGEVSPLMLNDLGVRMVIVGHSERRQIFHETDGMINQRLHGALRSGLLPILCIGETLEERERNITFPVLEQQLRNGLVKVGLDQVRDIVLAYEPVWAIGTGKTASTGQAQEVHAFLRKVLADIYEKNIANTVRILYGGSVKPENIDDFMAQTDIDGALVGGAALKAESFARIMHFS